MAGPAGSEKSRKVSLESPAVALQTTEKSDDVATAAEGGVGHGGHVEGQAEVINTMSAEEDTSTDSEPEDAKFSNFWRILSYGDRLDFLLMAVAAVSAIGAGIALPLMNIVFGNLVGTFNRYFIPGSGVTKQQFLDAVAHNSLYIVYLFIAKFVLAYISMYSFRMTGIRVSASLRLAYMRAVFKQSISTLDKLPSGQANDLITSAANTIQIGISEKLSLLVQSLALIVTSYVIAFRYSWLLTLISSSTLVFLTLAYGIIVPFIIKGDNSINHANEKASTIASDVFGSIRTVLSLGAEEAMKAKYGAWTAEAKKRGLRMSWWAGSQFTPSFFGIYANFALTFWYGVRMYNDGRINSIGTIVIVIFSVLLVVTSLSQVVVPMLGITKAATASTGFFTMINTPVPPDGGLKDPEVSANTDIVFDNVSFAYPSRPETGVLKGLNLRLPAGKITAIVGPSGSGKSTIVGLLEKWYLLSDQNERLEVEDGKGTKTKESDKKNKRAKSKDKNAQQPEKGCIKGSASVSGTTEKNEPLFPTTEEQKPVLQNSGTIMMDGKHTLESLDSKWWRSQIGLVQQEPFLFNDTIYKNIALGLIGSRWENDSDESKKALVEAACAEAFADEFILRLPQGYETKVGESGIKLSGGQRQRLAIARSIIKRPVILILDEATSSIDVRGERIVQAALDRVSKNRTTVTIAHRLSTIRKADHIVVLKDGSTIEEGTHESLLADPDGMYHGLIRAQHLELGATEQDDDINVADEATRTFDLALARTKSKGSLVNGIEELDEVAKLKNKGFLRTVGLFLYEQRRYWILYVFVIASAAGCGAAYASQSFIFGKFVQIFQETGARLISSGDFWALMFFILALAVAACYFVLGVASNSIATYVATTYRQEYFESILMKPITFFDGEENSSGTLSSRLTTDPTQLREVLGINMAFPLIALFNILGTIVISFIFGWKLTLVALFAVLPIILGAAFMRIRFELQFEAMNAKVFAESSQFAAESIKAFRTVTALTLEDSILERYEALLADHVSKAFVRARLAVLIFALSDSIDLLCMALTFWYGGQLMSTHEYNVLQFFVIYLSVVQGGQAAGQALSFGPNIAQATAAANRILAYRESPGAESSEELSAPTGTENSNGGVRIEFKDVAFVYPTRDVPVFKNLNVTVEPGQFVAFVGPSGCGKTTIISLLERFYDITSGSITVGGVDIRSRPAAEYRQSIALVSQEPTLFEGTIRSNLLLGIPPNIPSPSDATIQAATTAASLHTFISSLPSSYATPLQSSTHASLSGGQKQRLCIARALLRKPRLLLLDEATSSLDSASEREVQMALEKIIEGKQMTVCVVAHRLATVQRADRIFVLGEGGGKGSSVVESGTHQELVKQRGVYFSMCQAQALDR